MSKDSKDKHDLRNGIIAATIGAVALPLLAWFFGLLGRALRAFVSIGRFFIASSSVPRWVIVLLVIMSLPTLYLMLRPIIRKKSSGSQSDEPNFHDYTQDVFEGFDGTVWRWLYNSADNSIWRVTAFCPRCDMQLFARYQGARPIGYLTTLLCENCHWHSGEIAGNPDDIEGRVSRLIHRKLRSGEWESVVKQLSRIESE
jgi:hypothetical protein